MAEGFEVDEQVSGGWRVPTPELPKHGDFTDLVLRSGAARRRVSKSLPRACRGDAPPNPNVFRDARFAGSSGRGARDERPEILLQVTENMESAPGFEPHNPPAAIRGGEPKAAAPDSLANAAPPARARGERPEILLQALEKMESVPGFGDNALDLAIVTR